MQWILYSGTFKYEERLGLEPHISIMSQEHCLNPMLPACGGVRSVY
jgi:hypothetical protein